MRVTLAGNQFSTRTNPLNGELGSNRVIDFLGKVEGGEVPKDEKGKTMYREIKTGLPVELPIEINPEQTQPLTSVPEVEKERKLEIEGLDSFPKAKKWLEEKLSDYPKIIKAIIKTELEKDVYGTGGVLIRKGGKETLTLTVTSSEDKNPLSHPCKNFFNGDKSYEDSIIEALEEIYKKIKQGA